MIFNNQQAYADRISARFSREVTIEIDEPLMYYVCNSQGPSQVIGNKVM